MMKKDVETMWWRMKVEEEEVFVLGRRGKTK
jgi:hypothetical protein